MCAAASHRAFCVALLIFALELIPSFECVHCAAHTSTAPLSRAPHRRATHPRDFYLGSFNTSCVRPPPISKSSLSAEAAARVHARLVYDDEGPECFSGEGVRVAVLDTGLCAHFSTYSRNNVTCTSVVPGVACEDAGCGHGTRSVSVLAGHLLLPPAPGAALQRSSPLSAPSAPHRHFFGMAPRAHVRVFRVFDRDGRTHTRFLVAALDVLLREAKAAHGLPVDLISLSYGGEDYYANAAVQRRLYTLMHHYGVLVVAAAGNDHRNFGRVRSPADMPGVIAVGALRFSGAGAAEQKVVASFSGRGPTTWELPFGAGRLKPDLVALGHRVQAVDGVSVRTNTSLSRLRLRTVSGTSIAAPIVAGVVATALEAVRWDAVSARSTAVEGITSDPREGVYWVKRVETSLRVRQLLLTTARPLTPQGVLVDTDTNTAAAVAAAATRPPPPRTVLAGQPLTLLYARYLALMKWSVLSQGLGEVQPRRVWQQVMLERVAQAAEMRTHTCTSFAIPLRLVVGGAPMPASATNTTGSLSAASAVYWWPYADMMLYPGAVPVVLNVSVHLCPWRTQTVAGVHSSQETARDASYALDFHVTRVTGHRRDGGRGANTTALFSLSEHTQPSSSSSRGVVRLLRRHLLRAESILRPVAPSLSSLDSSLPAVPTTSFTLTTALYVPSSAHTRLRYCADKRTDTCEPQRDASVRNVSSGSSSSAHPAPPCSRACVPLFHAFTGLTVEGEARVHRQRKTRNASDTDGTDLLHAVLRVPLTVHIWSPPPLMQRVLVDTSLDWLNPTATSSDLFVAGDDPHEATAQERGGDGTSSPRIGYAEVGGDHPHTNLALLSLYLRRSLGLAVSHFPLLQVASSSLWNGTASSSSSSLRANAGAAAAEALSRVGTLVVIDPERTLSLRMRKLLTAAVRPRNGADGLRVVLVTDWYSTRVAEGMRWTREGGVREDNDAKAAGNGSEEGEVPLRAWRYSRLRNGSESHREGNKTPVEGLAGSCHVPSWNRWFDALARDVAEAAWVGFQSGEERCCAAASATRPPFYLSEDIVLDGTFTIGAGRASGISARGREGGSDSAYRSLGRLNAAGVLQWTAATSPLAQVAKNHSSSSGEEEQDEQSASRGEAVLCNVPSTWARVQRRLSKRAAALSSAQSSPSSKPQTEEDVSYDDMWEAFADQTDAAPVGAAEEEEEEQAVARIGGVPALPARLQPPLPSSGEVAASLSRGILGFWTLPPARHLLQRNFEGRKLPGRVAIFTDSNCLSTEDATVQEALSRLDSILSSLPPIGTDALLLHALHDSAEGRRFLREESAQSSTCVEVVKELLAWSLTGDRTRWSTSAQLQCDVQDWPPVASHASGGDSCAAPERGGEEEEFADLLHTAPERGDIGADVVELWTATVVAPQLDDDVGSADESSQCEAQWEAANTFSPLCDAGLSTPARRQEQWSDSNEASQKAEREVWDAVTVSYHADWAGHMGIEDRKAHKPSVRPAQGSTRSSVKSNAQFSMLNTDLKEALRPLYWLWHPVVVTQVIVSAGFVLWFWYG